MKWNMSMSSSKNNRGIYKRWSFFVGASSHAHFINSKIEIKQLLAIIQVTTNGAHT